MLERRNPQLNRHDELVHLLSIEGLPREFPPPRGLEQQTVKEAFVAPRRSRARLLAAAALAAVALVTVLAFAVTRGSSVTVVANSLAAIDPKSNGKTAP